MTVQGPVVTDGKTREAEGVTSRRSAIPLLLVSVVVAMMLSGCGDPNRRKITGKWELETAGALSSRLDTDESADDEDAAGDGPKMLIDFLNSGQLVTTTRIGSIDRSKTGTWEWLSYDESTATATLKCVLEMQETETVVVFEDEDTIEMIPPNLAGLSLKHKFIRSR